MPEAMGTIAGKKIWGNATKPRFRGFAISLVHVYKPNSVSPTFDFWD